MDKVLHGFLRESEDLLRRAEYMPYVTDRGVTEQRFTDLVDSVRKLQVIVLALLRKET